MKKEMTEGELIFSVVIGCAIFYFFKEEKWNSFEPIDWYCTIGVGIYYIYKFIKKIKRERCDEQI
jgi:hypothetical protein